MRFEYKLSKAFRERRFIEAGEVLDQHAVVEYDVTRLSPMQRAHIVRLLVPRNGGVQSFALSRYAASLSQGKVVPDGVWECDQFLQPENVPAAIQDDAERYDEALTALSRRQDEAVDRWIEEARALLEQVEALDPATAGSLRLPHVVTCADDFRYVRMLPSVLGAREAEVLDLDAQLVAAVEAKRAEIERVQRERRAQEEAARAAHEREKAEWIARHGSERLRRQTAAGYDCQRRYVLERAAQEFPDYVLDFNDAASWRSRSCVSDEAFEEASRVGGTVVWLTAPPSSALPQEEGDEEEFKQTEAVVVREYLGKYDLIRMM